MASKRKKSKLGQTLMDIPSPVDQRPTSKSPSVPPAPMIDAERMLAAWDKHTEVLGNVLDAIERNEEDNEATRTSARRARTSSYLALAGMALVGYLVWSSVTKSSVAVQDLEAKATFALEELEKTQQTMRIVSEAMVKSNDAARVEVAQANIVLPTVPLRHGEQVAVPPNVEVIKARVVAQEASLRAQVHLLDDEKDAPKKAMVRKKLAKVTQEGRALNIDSF